MNLIYPDFSDLEDFEKAINNNEEVYILGEPGSIFKPIGYGKELVVSRKGKWTAIVDTNEGLITDIIKKWR